MKPMTGLVGMCAVSLAVVFTLAQPAMAQDDPRAVPLFSTQQPLSSVLNAAKANGKALVLVVSSGTSYTGKIKDVGTEGVIVTELRGKEFFDAWIRLDAIVAMEERVRMR